MNWTKVKRGVMLAEKELNSPKKDNGSLALSKDDLRIRLVDVLRSHGLGPASGAVSSHYADYVSLVICEPAAAQARSLANALAQLFGDYRWWKVTFSQQPDSNKLLVIAYRYSELSSGDKL
jgi:hypothetical protein